MATIEHDADPRHDQLVIDWRLEELLRAGYSMSDALLLAAALEVDLRIAVRLLAEGCPPATAMRILV